MLIIKLKKIYLIITYWNIYILMSNNNKLMFNLPMNKILQKNTHLVIHFNLHEWNFSHREVLGVKVATAMTSISHQNEVVNIGI